MFDGRTYEHKLDNKRLGSQLHRVAHLMRDGQWRTLRTIAERVGGSEASVSARLRDLRKPKFSIPLRVRDVERRRVADGLFEYRVVRV